jgi:uncharacterized protein (DUF58 family)
VPEPLFTDDFLKKLDLLTLVARRGAGRGAVRPDRKGGRVEFADHRAYAVGDELRYVDWHLYGRLGRLFVKEFAREEEAEVLLVLDTSASMEEKGRGALRLSAALLVVGLAKGDRVRIATARDGDLAVSGAFEGNGRRGEILSLLAGTSFGGDTDLDSSLRALPPRRGPGRRLTLVVSDLLAERDGRKELARQRGDSVVFHWLAREEIAPTAEGRLTIVSAESGSLDAWVGPAERTRYALAMEEHLAELRDWLGRRGVRYLLAEAERPAEELLLDVLVREGVLE